MRVRLYSIPFGAGLANQGFSLFISYVFAGGGDVRSRTVTYDSPCWQRLPNNVMGFPRSDEIFALDGINRRQFQTGDVIQLRASDDHYVGIDHDEEDRTDSVVANALNPGPNNEFVVTVVQDPSVIQQLGALHDLDPCGPPQAITLLGRNRNFLSFPFEDGLLDIGGDVAGRQQTFAFDFLLDPLPHMHLRHRP